MRYRILLVLLIAAAGFYFYSEFTSWRSKPSMDSVHQTEADRARSMLPGR